MPRVRRCVARAAPSAELPRGRHAPVEQQREYGVGTTPATCAGGPAQLAGAGAPQDMCVAAQAISHRIALSPGRLAAESAWQARRVRRADNSRAPAAAPPVGLNPHPKTLHDYRSKTNNHTVYITIV